MIDVDLPTGREPALVRSAAACLAAAAELPAAEVAAAAAAAGSLPEALRPHDPPPVELLLVGGRSGAGKTTAAAEVSEQLQAAGLAHCLVEGDALDAAHPKPQGDPTGQRMTLTGLRALWGTFRAAGHWRCVYVNTASLLEPDLLAAAVGADRVVGVLLTAGDATVAERLARREVGSALAVHLERSASKAALLDERVGPWAVRVSTDGRTAVEVAADVVEAAGWARARAAVAADTDRRPARGPGCGSAPGAAGAGQRRPGA